MKLDLSESRIGAFVRRMLDIGNHAIPVYITDTGDRPAITGTDGGWFTNGGDRIAHPVAYARRGWSNMIYLCDDREVYVGQRWIERKILDKLK